jgi:hypothetical protein
MERSTILKRSVCNVVDIIKLLPENERDMDILTQAVMDQFRISTSIKDGDDNINVDDRARALMIAEANTRMIPAIQPVYQEFQVKQPNIVYALFDSRWSIATGSSTRLSWQITTTSKDQPIGAIVFEDLKNIKSIKMTGFQFPRTTRIANNNNRLAIRIMEISNVGYIYYGRININIIMKLQRLAYDTAATQQLEAIPTDNASFAMQKFLQPIVSLTTFTLEFYDPSDLITLPTNPINAQIIPGTFSVTNAKIYVAAGHTSVLGDIIYITGVTSTSPLDDAIIASLNREKGWIITNINDATNFEISLGINLATMVGTFQYPTFPLFLFLNSRRIIIPVEFECS